MFGPRRKIIFVHGCFWHLHPKDDCLDFRKPKSNRGYWLPKLRRNVERDAEHLAALRKSGWKVHVIWECETGDRIRLAKRLLRFLDCA